MTTENPELDEINRLLEVEKQAALLIEQAMTDADKKISEARSQFNEQFKSQSEKITQQLTEEYNNSIENIKQKHQKEIEAFKVSLEEKTLNQNDFNSLLNKYLFASA